MIKNIIRKTCVSSEFTTILIAYLKRFVDISLFWKTLCHSNLITIAEKKIALLGLSIYRNSNGVSTDGKNVIILSALGR